jgi:predicted DNA-binding transcriptional regulator
LTSNEAASIHSNEPKAERRGGRPASLTLAGTTLRVYRYLYREGRPLGVTEIQRGLALSSASVAHYNVRKLLDAGLVREDLSGGYMVDRMVFENMIRVKRTLVPIQSMLTAFLGTGLGVLLTFLRPDVPTPAFVFSLVVITGSFCVSVAQTVQALSQTRI